MESLTESLVVESRKLLDEVEELGGMTRAVEQGFPKQRIEEAAAIRQAKIDQGISPKGHHMDFETLQRVAKLGVRLDISDQTHLSNYQRLLLQNLWEQPEL